MRVLVVGAGLEEELGISEPLHELVAREGRVVGIGVDSGERLEVGQA